MRAKDFIPASKPRNFVAKNSKTAGAGVHKDKKRAEKQGDVKHKKPYDQGVVEAIGNDFRVGQRVVYTTGRGEKFPSIVTAVDFDEDAVKIKNANNKPFPNSGGDIEIVVDPGWKFLTVEPRVDPDSIIAVSPSMRKTTERIRDPEDWDEGNTEPGNNFAIYINGKKWKVFPGPYGAYADSPEEEREYYRLKDMARRKSEQTGKKWEVYKTGEKATESIDEGWKEKLAAAGLAGAMALGAGNAAARVSGDGDPSINRLTGKPIATQVSQSDIPKQDAVPLSSRYTSGAQWPAAYTIEYEGETYKFAGRTEAAPKGGKEIKVPATLVGVRGLSAVTVTLGKDGKYYAGSAD
jgi:hypothetical protein